MLKEEEKSKPVTGPFVILHDYRTNKHNRSELEHRARRHPHDYSQDRKSIIMTRKMKAELEHKEQTPSQLERNNYYKSDGENEQILEENYQFFTQNQLQKCIPLADLGDEDILYNVSEFSRASNYSKLERALFGLPPPQLLEQQKNKQQQ